MCCGQVPCRVGPLDGLGGRVEIGRIEFVACEVHLVVHELGDGVERGKDVLLDLAAARAYRHGPFDRPVFEPDLKAPWSATIVVYRIALASIRSFRLVGVISLDIWEFVG